MLVRMKCFFSPIPRLASSHRTYRSEKAAQIKHKKIVWTVRMTSYTWCAVPSSQRRWSLYQAENLDCLPWSRHWRIRLGPNSPPTTITRKSASPFKFLASCSTSIRSFLWSFLILAYMIVIVLVVVGVLGPVIIAVFIVFVVTTVQVSEMFVDFN